MSDEMNVVLELLRAAPRELDKPVDERRTEMDALAGASPLAEGTEIEAVEVAGRPAEWLRPPGVDEEAALLYLHGGGYCVGSMVSHKPLASKLAVAAGLPALLLDYRMGPEDPFPAAVEDATAAVRWLVDQGCAPARLAVAGDSAGGGLTLATLVALREDGGPLPGAAALLSPWTDLTLSLPSMDANVTSDPMLDRAALQIYADWYLGEHGDPKDPLASPRFADLGDLPPLLIHAAEDEVLRDDARVAAQAVKESGGVVEYRTWPGVFHVWHATAGVTPEADEAVAAVGAFLRAHRS